MELDQVLRAAPRVPVQRTGGTSQLCAHKLSSDEAEDNRLLRVRNSDWPMEEFCAYLSAKRDAAGFASDAALARAADIDPSLISNWRNGNAQPSRKSLDKLAPVLKVRRMNLWIVAGIADEEDLTSPPPSELDDAPDVILDLLTLYRDPQMTEEDRASLRKWLTYQIAGVRSELGARTVPKDRRSA